MDLVLVYSIGFASSVSSLLEALYEVSASCVAANSSFFLGRLSFWATLLADGSYLPRHDLHVSSETSLVTVSFVAKVANIHDSCLKLLYDVT